MANQGKVHFGIDFSVDKTVLNDLKQSLQQIQQQAQQMSLTGNATQELQQTTEAAKQLQQILDNAWNNKLNQWDLSKFNRGIKESYGSLEAFKTSLTNLGPQGAKSYNELARSVFKTNLQVKQSNKLLDEMATSMANTVKWGITSAIFNNISNSIQKAWDYSIKLDTSLNDIRIVTGKSAENMADFAIQANRAAKELGASTRDYTEASLIYYQQGLSDEETQARTETTLKAANVTGQRGDEVSEQLTAIWNGYKVNAQEAELYIDKVAAVAAATAADLEELSTGMGKVASAANTMGVNVDQMNALLATAVSVTREAPETIGTSFRSIFSRMGQLKSDGTDEFGVTLGKVTTQLQSMGIEILDQQGNMRDMGTVITEVGEKWQGWTQAQKVAAAQAMAGTQQYSRLMAVFENWDMYEDALSTSQNALGTLNKQQDIFMESTEAHLQQLTTEAEKTYDLLFDQEMVNGFSDALTDLLSIFNTFLDSLGGSKQILTYFGATVSKIFSKQISQGISTHLNNLDKQNQSKQELQIAQEVAKTGMASTDSGYQNEAYENDLKNAKDLLGVQKLLTNEEYNKLNALRQEISDSEHLYQTILEFGENSNESYKIRQKYVEQEKQDLDKEVKSYVKVQSLLEEIDSFDRNDIEQDEERLNKELELLDIIGEIKDEKSMFNGEQILSQEQINGLQVAYNKLNNEEALNETDIKNILDAQNASVQAHIQYDKILTQEALMQKQYEDGTLELLRKQYLEKQKEYALEMQRLQKAQSINAIVQGVSALVQAGTALSGIINTLSNEDLSGWEKFQQISLNLLTTLPMLITSFSSITKLLPNIAIALGATNLTMKSTAKEALAAQISIFGLKMAMWEFYLIIAMLAAAVAIVVGTVKMMIDNFNADAIAAEKAAKQAKLLTERYKELKDAYQDLKDTMSEYKEARQGLAELEKGTDEYAQALEEANEKARTLIETLGLYGDYIYQNGEIIIDEEALKKAEQEKTAQLNRAENQALLGQLAADQAQMRSETTDLSRSFGVDGWETAEQLFKASLMNLIPGVGVGYTIAAVTDIATAGTENIRKIDSNELTEIATFLQDLKDNENLDFDYETLITADAKTVEEALLSVENLPDIVRKNIETISENIKSIDEFASSLDAATEKNLYTTEQLASNMIQESHGQEISELANGDIAKENQINAALVKLNNNVVKDMNTSLEYVGKRTFSEVKSNKDLQAYGFEVENDEHLARLYAEKILNYTAEEVDSMSYQGGTGQGTLKIGDTIVSGINKKSDEEMRQELARFTKLEEMQNIYGDWMDSNNDYYLEMIKRMDDTVSQIEKDFDIDVTDIMLNTIASGDTSKLDFSNYFTNLKPSDILQMQSMDSNEIQQLFGLSEDDLYEMGYETVEEFYQAVQAGLEEYDVNPYLQKVDKQAKEAQESLDILSKGDESELSDEQLSFLKSLEAEYQELGDIQDRTSHEYLETLREIKEQLETNTIEALRFQQAQDEQLLEESINDLEELEKQLKNATDEAEKEQLQIEITAKTDLIEETLQSLEDTNYEIKVKLEADLATDVDDAFGLAEEFSQLQDVLNEDLEYTFEEAQALIDKGYGAMLQNAIETSNQTIKLNKQTVNAFIDGKQAELNADKESKIGQLQNQRAILVEQKIALENRLTALKEALNAENTADAATAMAKASNANLEYQSKVTALNQILSDEAEGATEKEKINKELFTDLGGMYETDSENQQQAEIDATNTQKEEIDKRINNAKALYNAYVSVGNSVRAAVLGLPPKKFNAGTTQSGGSTSTTGSKKVTSKDIEAEKITPEDLQKKIEELWATDEGKKEYTNTVNALIDQTNKQIKDLNSQIGSIDSGIAALKSSNISLDKFQKGLGKPDKNEIAEVLDMLKDEADIYHDINIEIQKTETNLKRLQKQQEKAYGTDLINNLNEQLKLLDEQVENYSKKIDIATIEATMFKTDLEKHGVTFEKDGTISNYKEAFNNQKQIVDDLRIKYNKMTKEEQEAFQETLDKAEENFEKFKQNIEEYDKIITNLIPNLQDDIQEALDQQIEISVEKFNMEIETRLDMSQAERDWNEFKKKVIDNIDDDDILGNAKANLEDFSSYYKDDLEGVVQVNTDHVNDILFELDEMDRGLSSKYYGEDRAKALEDLKTYYGQLMDDLIAVEDLSDKIRQSYLDMMDEAKEKFDEQISTYEQIADLIDHDIKLIELLGGEKSYTAFGEYYNKLEINNNKQLDFQRQQVEFWKAQMEAAKEDPERWEKAKENWTAAVTDWRSLVNESIENLQDKYLNTISSIFEELNKKVTNELGLEYVNEQWGLINRNAEEYLDTINAMYGIQELENKYLDAIDQTDSISAQKELNKLMEQEIAALEEKDKLTQYDIDRANMRYNIALKQIALEEAQQNKTSMRLKRDSQGNYSYQFIADEDAVGKAEDELAAAQNELYNFDKENYINNLDELYAAYEEYQQKMFEAAQINDPDERAQKELLINEQYGELINGLVEQNQTIRSNLHESAFDELARLYKTDVENYRRMSEEERNILLNEMIPQWTSGVQQMADTFAGEGGLGEVCKESLAEISQATEDYKTDLEEVEEAAGLTFEEIVSGTDDAIIETEDLLKVNDELIEQYEDELDAIDNVINELDKLIERFEKAKQAAINASKEAYGYFQSANDDMADEAFEDRDYSEDMTRAIVSGYSTDDKHYQSLARRRDKKIAESNVQTDVTSSRLKKLFDAYRAGDPKAQTVVMAVYNGKADYTDKFLDEYGFKTGGYTGNWTGETGRLALLHQKELVLNAEDTQNVLGAVKILRNITDLIGNSVIRKAAAMSGNITTPQGGNITNETLEQDVHIDAHFPNVTNSREIENALDNLMNKASQRALRKR